MNSAKKLLRLNFNAHTFSTRAPNPPAIPKEQLGTLEKIIETHNGRNSTLPDKESLRQIYRQFITTSTWKLSSEFDSIRRIRQLAWTLTYTENEEPRIVDTPKLQSALQLIENRFRISMLPGIFNALLQAWDTFKCRHPPSVSQKTANRLQRISEIYSETENKYRVVL